MPRMYRDVASTQMVIEGYGTWNLNYLVFSNPGGTNIRIDAGDGGAPEEINTWDITEILTEAGSQAGIDVTATLAYLNGENDDVLPGTQDDVTTQINTNPAVVANTAKVSADGSIDTHSDVDTTTTPPVLGDVLEWDGANWVPAAIAGMVFGTQWTSQQSGVAGNTTLAPTPANNILTATFPATYLTLTTPNVPAGDYLLEWYYVWAYDAANTDFVARINQDSAAALFGFHRQRPRDVAGGGEPDAIPGAGTDQRHQASGRQVVTLTAGVHTFALEYAAGVAGVIASIGNATMNFYRVA
ncbi:MAG: hypothetical protein AMS18_13180 [Gemmatimonas sp. SG8_17]|nr:MAG: hypothetical protein AMS18_13180 [Gemmatimonas sp. SG8_17]